MSENKEHEQPGKSELGKGSVVNALVRPYSAEYDAMEFMIQNRTLGNNELEARLQEFFFNYLATGNPRIQAREVIQTTAGLGPVIMAKKIAHIVYSGA